MVMRKVLLNGVSLFGLGFAFAAQAADVPLKAPVVAPPPAWNWSGAYIGAHAGASWGTTDFANPFGASIFGENVIHPGFMGGGQIGYNWQAPGSRWVYGVEAALSGFDSDGTVTCFSVTGNTLNSTCRVQPRFTATFAGRFGATIDPFGRTLVYGKAGLAVVNNQINMATNDSNAGLGGLPLITSTSQNITTAGFVVGAGIERAITPAWSLRFEYDFMGFRDRASNLGSASFDLSGNPLGAVAPGTSNYTQNIQTATLGLNYKFGADPWARFDDTAAATGYYKAEAPVMPAWATGWEFEAGGRYVGSWGRFQKDLGQFQSSGLPSISAVSRLTYDDMQSNAGEFFGRIESPWNLFVKGFAGGGDQRNGHMNDEDFGIALLGAFAGYSNTLASIVSGNNTYYVVDGGYDFLRGPGYKVGVFGGYFSWDSNMNAFGCSPVASFNCIPNTPTSGSPNITENDTWKGARIGVEGEVMLAPKLRLSGEVAYLPSVQFTGVDHHFFGNSGVIASVNPESGSGSGVQAEGILSYFFTPYFSLGVGARYWAMWTTEGSAVRTVDDGVPITPTPPQFFKGAAEQAAGFVQASIKFGGP
jgi:opacity protein-like surface antigen